MTISSFACMSTQLDQEYDRVVGMLKYNFEKRSDSIKAYKHEFISHGYTKKLFDLQTIIDECNRDIRHLVAVKHDLLDQAKKDSMKGFEILPLVHQPYDDVDDDTDFMTYVDLCKEYEESDAYGK